MKPPPHKAGDRLKFRTAKRAFPVVATNLKYTICAYRLTGALAKYEFLYTIVDWENDVRGPDDLIFGPAHNYLDPVVAKKALGELGPGYEKRGKVFVQSELSLSRRRALTLDFERVIPARIALAPETPPADIP